MFIPARGRVEPFNLFILCLSILVSGLSRETMSTFCESHFQMSARSSCLSLSSSAVDCCSHTPLSLGLPRESQHLPALRRRNTQQGHIHPRRPGCSGMFYGSTSIASFWVNFLILRKLLWYISLIISIWQSVKSFCRSMHTSSNRPSRRSVLYATMRKCVDVCRFGVVLADYMGTLLYLVCEDVCVGLVWCWPTARVHYFSVVYGVRRFGVVLATYTGPFLVAWGCMLMCVGLVWSLLTTRVHS